jgi:hypothetical protein
MKGSSSSHLREEYVKTCKQVKIEEKLAINRYELRLAEKSKRDPKLVYSYVKGKQTVKDQVRAVIDKSGKLVADRNLVAEVLNDQFQSVFVVESSCGVEELPEFRQRRNDCFGIDDLKNCFSVEIIEKALSELSANKAGAVDEINSFVLKMCAHEFAIPLNIIFQRSLIEGKVPSQWKVANITPIFKKGSRAIAANYRPVSLTSIL